MNDAIENLKTAQQRGMAGRPKTGGFPYLAETLRRAGITRNLWFLPACQSVYLTEMGPVAVQGTPLIDGMADVPPFNREALIAALRTDQSGRSTFPEFLMASWKAGVVKYDVDLVGRTCTYYGVGDEAYVETYPEVEV
ncbi:DUF1398 family protein [Polaromonas sp. C04]|uniref:DUF1398 domain-containing protein n=1 Tax=Polaromonas sp. C04 TaxID=1945857 RepID=UPI000985AFFF|nr:DUF1398 family protein [Polaromonas sp. C04]OOG58124.1 DUF1398 domain-containing protein [Polaromonas sp. C04]